MCRDGLWFHSSSHSDSLAPCESVHMNHFRRSGSDRAVRSVVRAESVCLAACVRESHLYPRAVVGLVHGELGSGKRARGMRDERASGCCW